jgi:hypothetical protein
MTYLGIQSNKVKFNNFMIIINCFRSIKVNKYKIHGTLIIIVQLLSFRSSVFTIES